VEAEILSFELKTQNSLVRWLLRIGGVLIIFHLLNLALGKPSWQLYRIFDVGAEANIPTWFSSLLLFFASLTAFQCSKKVSLKLDRALWFLIAGCLLIFSIDEIAMIHEHVFTVIREQLLPPKVQEAIVAHFKETKWPVVAAPFVIVLGIFLVSSLKRLLKNSPQAAKLLLVGFGLVIGSAWGLELTENLMNEGALLWFWELERVAEESLEILGVIFIIKGLLAQRHVLGQLENSHRTFKVKEELALR